MKQTLIQHLTTKKVWEEALLTGHYQTSTLDKTLAQVGFIHASFPEQLQGVAAFVFADCTDELVVLHMDIEILIRNGITVRIEPASNGQLYPHIFNPIPCNLVNAVLPALMGIDGKLHL